MESGRGAVKPVLTLLDLKVPRADGPQISERLRGDDRTKRLPVVILTSLGEEIDDFGSHELGVNGRVCRHPEFSEFSDTVAQPSRCRFLLNERPRDGR